MDRQEISHLMSNAYHSTDNFYTFAEQINRYNPQLVIDAGCGTNLWKNKVKNLVGFDKKAHENLDHMCTYIEFDNHVQPESADFIFCLGSMHHKNGFDKELDLVYKWLKPGGRIIMRVRADLEDDSVSAWTLDDIKKYTEHYNYTIEKPIEEKCILLNELDDDTFAWIKKKANSPSELNVIAQEQERRSKNLEYDTVFKSWYIWWWKKD